MGLLIHINRCTLWESYAVGTVESLQLHLFVVVYACPDGYYGAQQFAVLSRIEARQRQFVPALLGLIIYGCQTTDVPDEVIGGFSTEPRLQHIAYAEPLVLTSEEAPRALQPLPELHEAFLGVLNFYHT